MPISANDYETVDRGIKLHKTDRTKVLFSVVWRENGQQKRKRKTIKMQYREHWGKREYIKEAKRLYAQYTDDRAAGIDDSATVNTLYSAYYATKEDTDWKKIQAYTYDKHIRAAIGDRRAVDLKRSSVDAILTKMRKAGAKPRTQKLILNVLRPMFTYAMQEGIIKSDPTAFITVKLPKTKKPVIDATGTFKQLWYSINTLYCDDPFYLAMFKFLILQGRRKGEVFSLRWDNIDFANSLYTIENTKSGEDQTYQLPATIADDLNHLPKTQSGYVFESPVKIGKMVDIRSQVDKVRKHSGVDTFTPHYARNVLVSMLAEQGVNAIYLSGALGHTDANTINKYLSMPRKEASRMTENVIDTVVQL